LANFKSADEELSFLSNNINQDPNSNPASPASSSAPQVRRDEFSYAYSSVEHAADIPELAGTKSLFNNYAMFRYESAGGNSNMLFDNEGKGITPSNSRNPSARAIIEWSQEQPSSYSSFGATPYAWSDFLWCEYYGKIPNNYMVTLRRYPIPVSDNLKAFEGKHIPPLAQAITYLGEQTGNKLSDILKFSAGLKWKEIEADVQEVFGQEKGFGSSPFANTAAGSVVGNATAFFGNQNDYSGLSQAREDYASKMYGSEGPYANKVYGPVNVIHKTMARDRGMDFDQDFTITFNYEAKSIGGVNPKIAMLDILANMLSLTYNNAKFWGGAIRYFPQHPRVAFLGDQKKFYSGDVGGYIDSVMGDLGKLGGNIGNVLKDLMANPIEALKKLAFQGGKMAMNNKAAQDRPQIISMKSLLTGAPMGEWHLCVGNPMNPIAMIGNLVCDKVDVEFGDELGADDFPTKVKFTIHLKHGKPRDKGDIESMFNLGNGRLYYGKLGGDHNFFLKESDPKKLGMSSQGNSDVDLSNNPGGTKSTVDKDSNSSGAQTKLNAEQTVSSVKNHITMWGNRFKESDMPASIKFWD
jgi:hypothetical protein